MAGSVKRDTVAAPAFPKIATTVRGKNVDGKGLEFAIGGSVLFASAAAERRRATVYERAHRNRWLANWWASWKPKRRVHGNGLTRGFWFTVATNRTL